MCNIETASCYQITKNLGPPPFLFEQRRCVETIDVLKIKKYEFVCQYKETNTPFESTVSCTTSIWTQQFGCWIGI